VTTDLIVAVAEFCRSLDSLGIKYLIGGSFASGMWGEPRYTNDVDIEIWLNPSKSSGFAQTFDNERYILTPRELEAILNSTALYESIQVLDIEKDARFDCYLQGRSPIDQEAHEHAETVTLDSYPVRFACAEHILVQKLRWYKLGNRVSERQWRDLQGIVHVSTNLDWSLVRRWAEACDITDVLAELRAEEKI
jgi:hypothetical protein